MGSARGLLAVAAQASHKRSGSLDSVGGKGTPQRGSRVRQSRSSRSLRSAQSAHHVPTTSRSTRSFSRKRRHKMKRRKPSLGVIRSSTSSHLAVPGRRSSASLSTPAEIADFGDLDTVAASSPQLEEADFAGVGLNRSFSASALDK